MPGTTCQSVRRRWSCAGEYDFQLISRAVALAGLCGLRTESVIRDGKEHEYEVNMGCGLYQAWYLPDSLMWVVEAEGTVCAFTVDDRTGKVGPE